MNVKYTEETKRKAMEAVAAGRVIKEVAKTFGIPVNTLYMWTSTKGRTKGRKDLGNEVVADLAAMARRAPVVRPRLHAPVAAAAETPTTTPAAPAAPPTEEIETLRRENAVLRKLVEVYREAAGL